MSGWFKNFLEDAKARIKGPTAQAFEKAGVGADQSDDLGDLVAKIAAQRLAEKQTEIVTGMPTDPRPKH